MAIKTLKSLSRTQKKIQILSAYFLAKFTHHPSQKENLEPKQTISHVLGAHIIKL